MKNVKVEWKTCFRVGISAFLLFLAITYWGVVCKLAGTAIGAAAPLIIGAVIAYLVNILMARYEKWFFPRSQRKFVRVIRRPLCMTAAFVTLVAIVALVVALIVPQLYSCVMLLLAKVPPFIREVIAWVEKYDLLSEEYLSQLKDIDWKSRLGQIFDIVTSGVGSVMDVVITTVTSLFSGVVTAVISIIFSIYILASKERLGMQILRLMRRVMSEKWYGRSFHLLNVVNDSFRGYIVGQCTEAVILGVLCALGMWILQLPYAAMIGALIAFTALIPVAGAYIGAGVGAFMILTESPIKALIFLVFILVLQQLEGNLIYPKVVGSSIGLPGIWVLAAVTVGGGVMGITGMLIGVPIAAAAYKLLGEWINSTRAEKDEQKKQKQNKNSAHVGDDVPVVPPKPKKNKKPYYYNKKKNEKRETSNDKR
ncbi:MAG: AI-2E family transporter [Clostridia bacterium]|nr:AI-2E family transporter [Clostridia bacterium]